MCIRDRSSARLAWQKLRALAESNPWITVSSFYRISLADCTNADQREESSGEAGESFFLNNTPSWLTTTVSISGQLPFGFTAMYSTRERPRRPVAVIQHSCGSSCRLWSEMSSVFVTRISLSGAEPVSYTHLDVYKRQPRNRRGPA